MRGLPMTPRLSNGLARPVTQTVGWLILLGATYSAALLAMQAVQYYTAASYWLELGRNLPIWVLCWIGGCLLIRNQSSGFYPIYFALLFPLLGWPIAFLPFLNELVCPTTIFQPSIFIGIDLLIIALLVGLHVLDRKSQGRGRCQLFPRLARGLMYLALCTIPVACVHARRPI